MLDNPQIIIPAFGSPPLPERIGWKRVWLSYGSDNNRPRWVYKRARGEVIKVTSEILEEISVQNDFIRKCNEEHGTEISLLRTVDVDPDSDSEIETEAQIPVVVGGPHIFASVQPTRYLVWDFEYETWTVCPFHTTTSFLHRKYLSRLCGGLSSIEIELIRQTRDYHIYMRELLPKLASLQFKNQIRKRGPVTSD